MRPQKLVTVPVDARPAGTKSPNAACHTPDSVISLPGIRPEEIIQKREEHPRLQVPAPTAHFPE